MPGTPGRPPGAARAPAGRGPRSARTGRIGAGSRAAARASGPCPGTCENGLLPGRGAPGRRLPGAPAPGRPPVEPGRGRAWSGAWPLPGAPSAVRAGGSLPVRAAGGAAGPGARGTDGRGPGVRTSGCGLRVAGADGAGRVAVGGCLAAAWTRPAGAGAGSTRGPAGRRLRPERRASPPGRHGRVSGADGVGRRRRWRLGPGAGAAGAGAAGAFAGFLAGGGSLASFSLSRLSTGASTVEEADRTNSPMSFSMLRTVLLSTPSSFASS